MWQIPISEAKTTVGVVAEKEVFRKGKGDYAAWFSELSQSAPDIAHALRDARQVNEFKVEGDYSYSMQSFVGDEWMMVGDAARFVDPIFSSGVSVAMYSTKFASEQIRDVFEKNDYRRPALERYETRLKKGTAIWYEFILLYYKLLPLLSTALDCELSIDTVSSGARVQCVSH